MFYFVLATALSFALFCILGTKYRLPDSRLKSDASLARGVLAASLLCMGICVAVFVLLKKDALAYPFEKSISKCNAYEQMFDAFMKKILYIDVEPDEELILMGNPYNTALRKELDVKFLWDRAYYLGHYYSYFGIAPLILVYIPYYYITHTVPAAPTVCLIFALLTVPVVAFLTVKVQKLFCKTLNPVIVMFSVFAVEGASLVFMVQSSADNYYIPMQSGLLFLSVFLLASLTAYEHKDEAKKCCVYFFISGIALVFTVMSRPNMAVYFIMIIPIYLSVLASKEKSVKSKIGAVMSFAVPTALGAAFVMWYNYARFGSVFEFGSSYQLTVHDVRDYSYSAALILPTFFYYFFKQPSFSAHIPYLQIPFIGGLNAGRYVYLTSTVGAFSFPGSWSLVFSPALLYGQKNKVKSAFVFLGMACVFFNAFTDMCFAGVNLRYLVDISLVVALLAAVTLYDLYAEFDENKDRLRFVTFFVICALQLLSFLLGLMLIINNERDYIVKEYFE